MLWFISLYASAATVGPTGAYPSIQAAVLGGEEEVELQQSFHQESGVVVTGNLTITGTNWQPSSNSAVLLTVESGAVVNLVGIELSLDESTHYGNLIEVAGQLVVSDGGLSSADFDGGSGVVVEEGGTFSAFNWTADSNFSVGPLLSLLGNAVLEDCALEGNFSEKSIVFVGPQSVSEFLSTAVTDNIGDLEGVVAVEGDLSVEGGSFEGNEAPTGGALFLRSGSSTTVSDVQFLNNLADEGGAITSYGELSIENATFQNNEAVLGGALLLPEGSASLSFSVFDTNIAYSGFGGAIHSAGGLSLVDSSFENNEASGEGGALYLEATNTTTVSGSSFDGNISWFGSGGAVATHGSFVVDVASEFSGNESDDFGGAIYAVSGSLDVGPSKFENNYVVREFGGAIYTELALSIVGADFVGNSANKRGGAIYSTAALSLQNSDFNYNTVYVNDGGAVYSELGLTLDDVRFLSNVSPNYGGAVYTEGSFVGAQVQFSFNESSYQSGGAVYSLGDVTVDGGGFSYNQANRYGGAVHVEGSVASFNGVSFSNNIAEGNNGGAVFCAGELSAEQGSFVSNTASRSGGAIACDGAVTLVESDFEGNEANSNDGGAVFAGGALTVTGGTFSSNVAWLTAGALYGDLEVTVENATFTNNQARAGSSDGGAIGSYGDLTLTGCDFQSNECKDEGGALVFGTGITVVISNSSFVGNYAPSHGGAISTYGLAERAGSLTINDSLFFRNESEYGGAINTGFETNISSSRFCGNTGDYGTTLNTLSTSEVNNSFFLRNWGDSSSQGTIRGSKPITIDHGSFRENTAAKGAVFDDHSNSGTLTFRNSIVADHVAYDAVFDGGNSSVDHTIEYVRLYNSLQTYEDANDFSLFEVEDLLGSPWLVGLPVDLFAANDCSWEYALVEVSADTWHINPEETNADGSDANAGVFGGEFPVEFDQDEDGVFDWQDCDPYSPDVGLVSWVFADDDSDGDGFYSVAGAVVSCFPPEVDSVEVGLADCDDTSSSVFPGAVELCNGVDEDCDELVDDGLGAECVDGELCDGLDNNDNGSIDEGFSDVDVDGTADCVDIEECDGLDNNGDGSVDEGFSDVDGDGIADCVDVEECDGIDNDGDGFIDEGFSDLDGDGTADCVDVEECDGIDNNGDGAVDEGFPDVDGDGTADCVDVEECDGVDNDGDGVVDEGFPDADGDGTADCVEEEEVCDGIDNNGDGAVDEGFPDADGDGVADCVDVEECDGVDNDGDGVVDEGFPDTDGDGVADCMQYTETGETGVQTGHTGSLTGGTGDDVGYVDGPNTDKTGCGCSSSPAGVGWWSLLLVAAWASRRGRTSSQK